MQNSKERGVVLLAFVLITVGTLSYAQTSPSFTWLSKAGGTSSELPHGMAVGSDGYSYVVGQFQGVATFGAMQLTANDWDMFLTRVSPEGEFSWAVRAGGSSGDTANAVAVDATGYVYVIGSFHSGSITLGSTMLNNAGENDVFVCKLDSLGNFLWAVKAGGSGDDFGNGIALDAFGNIFVVGQFSSTATFGTQSLTASGSDMFIAKIDTNGAFQWARKAGGSGSEQANAVATDPQGNAHIIGLFTSANAAFGSTTLATTGGTDSFVSKVDGNGTFLWAKSISGLNDQLGHHLAVDRAGNVYVTGQTFSTGTFGTITLTANDWDMFIAKLNALGEFQWAKRAGGNSGDAGHRVAIDPVGGIYLAGAYHSASIDFEGQVLSNSGLNDLFIAKMSSEGQYEWVKRAGGTGDEIVQGLGTDIAGNVFVSGNFKGTSVFETMSQISSGLEDLFVARISTINLNLGVSAGNLVLWWPTNYVGFVLEYSPTLTPSTWNAVNTVPLVVGEQSVVVETGSSGMRFYRLRKP